jgi:hypothetical protein
MCVAKQNPGMCKVVQDDSVVFPLCNFFCFFSTEMERPTDPPQNTNSLVPVSCKYSPHLKFLSFSSNGFKKSLSTDH